MIEQALFLGFIGFAIGFILGRKIGISDTEEMLRRQVIESGNGEYYIDQDGEKQFRLLPRL